MKFYNQSFFVHDMKGVPVVHVKEDPENKGFPISIYINSDEERSWSDPGITFHFTSMSQYIKFKNSIIQAHEALVRRQNGPA